MTFSQPYRFTTDETLSQHGKVFSFWLEAVAEKKNGRFTYLEVGRLEGALKTFTGLNLCLNSRPVCALGSRLVSLCASRHG